MRLYMQMLLQMHLPRNAIRCHVMLCQGGAEEDECWKWRWKSKVKRVKNCLHRGRLGC